MTAEILAMFADSIITPRPLSKRKREQAQRREIRLAFEAGTISFWEMLAAYESGLDLGGEVENNERENNSYHEDGRRWVPVREDIQPTGWVGTLVLALIGAMMGTITVLALT